MLDNDVAQFFGHDLAEKFLTEIKNYEIIQRDEITDATRFDFIIRDGAEVAAVRLEVTQNEPYFGDIPSDELMRAYWGIEDLKPAYADAECMRFDVMQLNFADESKANVHYILGIDLSRYEAAAKPSQALDHQLADLSNSAPTQEAHDLGDR